LFIIRQPIALEQMFLNFLVAPRMALIIDTRAAPKNTIKYKETEKSIWHYPAFQQYVAAILAPFLQTFHASHFQRT